MSILLRISTLVELDTAVVCPEEKVIILFLILVIRILLEKIFERKKYFCKKIIKYISCNWTIYLALT